MPVPRAVNTQSLLSRSQAAAMSLLFAMLLSPSVKKN